MRPGGRLEPPCSSLLRQTFCVRSILQIHTMQTHRPRLLVVDDRPRDSHPDGTIALAEGSTSRRRHTVRTHRQLRHRPAELVLLDLRMPGSQASMCSGRIRDISPLQGGADDGYGTIDSAVEAANLARSTTSQSRSPPTPPTAAFDDTRRGGAAAGSADARSDLAQRLSSAAWWPWSSDAGGIGLIRRLAPQVRRR